MKIAYATDNYWPRMSGMAVSIDTFRRELAAQGHEVHVLAPEYGSEPESAFVHRFRALRPFFSPEDRLLHPAAEATVFARLDALRPDVVHVQTEMLLGRAAWRWAKARGVPLVMTCHTYWERYINHYLPFLPAAFGRWLVRTLARRIYDLADVLVVPSRSMQAVLEGYGVQAPMAVVPTGFEQASFRQLLPSHERSRSFLFEHFPQLRGKRVALTVTRVGQEKNLDFLVDVLAEAAPRHPDLMWLLVGDGPYRAALQRLLERRGLADRAVLAGYVDRPQMAQVFALADVFVYASTTESQGLATLEAMGCGLPVVAVGEMGTRDAMEGNRGGFLESEPGPFAERVLELLARPLLHRQKSEDARLRARAFGPDVMAARLAAVYAELTGSQAMPAKRPLEAIG